MLPLNSSSPTFTRARHWPAREIDFASTATAFTFILHSAIHLLASFHVPDALRPRIRFLCLVSLSCTSQCFSSLESLIYITDPTSVCLVNTVTAGYTLSTLSSILPTTTTISIIIYHHSQYSTVLHPTPLLSRRIHPPSRSRPTTICLPRINIIHCRQSVSLSSFRVSFMFAHSPLFGQWHHDYGAARAHMHCLICPRCCPSLPFFLWSALAYQPLNSDLLARCIHWIIRDTLN